MAKIVDFQKAFRILSTAKYIRDRSSQTFVIKSIEKREESVEEDYTISWHEACISFRELILWEYNTIRHVFFKVDSAGYLMEFYFYTELPLK